MSFKSPLLHTYLYVNSHKRKEMDDLNNSYDKNILEAIRNTSRKRLFLIRTFATIVDLIILSPSSYFVTITENDFIGILGLSIIFIFYNSFMEYKYGFTFGKLCCNLRVCSANGSKISIGMAIGRAFSKIFNFIPIVLIINLVKIANSTYHQRNGDILTSSYVISNSDIIIANTAIDKLKNVVIDQSIEFNQIQNNYIKYEITKNELSNNIREIRCFKKLKKMLIFHSILIVSYFNFMFSSVILICINLIYLVPVLFFYFSLPFNVSTMKNIITRFIMSISILIVVYSGYIIINKPSVLVVFMALSITASSFYFKKLSNKISNYSGQVFFIDRSIIFNKIRSTFRKSSKAILFSIAWKILLLIILFISLLFFIFYILNVLTNLVNEGTLPNLSLLIPGIISVILLIILALRRSREYLVSSVDDLLEVDKRSQIVFIRSFKDDSIKMTKDAFFSGSRFEEILNSNISKFGPIISIGKPNEIMAPLGIARKYIESKMSWKHQIADYFLKSSYIIAIPNSSEGFMWELNKIIELELIHKLIVIIPPIKSQEIAFLFESLNKCFPDLILNIEKYIELDNITGLKFYNKTTVKISYIKDLNKFDLRSQQLGQNEYLATIHELIN